jgi:hypothetical protein
MSYDPHAVLQAIDENTMTVLLFFAGAAICTFIFLIESFRLTLKHAAYSAPLAAVGWFAMHDLIFVLQYEKWFVEYNHWWCKAWWVALIFTALIEFTLVGMVIRYGRKELLPMVSQRQFAALVIAATLGIGVLWLVIKSVLNDDLYLISFPVTAFWALPFSTALLVKRQSLRGQSTRLEFCVIGIMLSFQGAFWPLDEVFRSPAYIALTVLSVFWGATNIWLMRRFPAYEPEQQGNSGINHVESLKLANT